MDKIQDFFGRKDVQTALIILLVLAVLYFTFKGDIDAFVKKQIGKKVKDIDEADSIDMDLMLSKGASGTEVIVLQRALLADGGTLPAYGVDGIFGNETQKALQSVKGVNQITLTQYKDTENLNGESSTFDFTNALSLYDGSGVQGYLDATNEAMPAEAQFA